MIFPFLRCCSYTCTNTVDMLSFLLSLPLSTTYGSCLYSCNCTVVVYSNGSNTDLHISGVLKPVFYVKCYDIPAQPPTVSCLVIPKQWHLNYTTPPRRCPPPKILSNLLQFHPSLSSCLLLIGFRITRERPSASLWQIHQLWYP